jgi:hypothetical protein
MEDKEVGRRDERREEGVSAIWEEKVWERRVERELGEKETSRWRECLMGRVWDCKELTFSPSYQFFSDSDYKEENGRKQVIGA